MTFPPRVNNTSYEVARMLVGGFHLMMAELPERLVRRDLGTDGTALSSTEVTAVEAV